MWNKTLPFLEAKLGPLHPSKGSLTSKLASSKMTYSSISQYGYMSLRSEVI